MAARRVMPGVWAVAASARRPGCGGVGLGVTLGMLGGPAGVAGTGVASPGVAGPGVAGTACQRGRGQAATSDGLTAAPFNRAPIASVDEPGPRFGTTSRHWMRDERSGQARPGPRAAGRPTCCDRLAARPPCDRPATASVDEPGPAQNVRTSLSRPAHPGGPVTLPAYVRRPRSGLVAVT